MPRTLLLSSTAPGSNGVGAIILRDLCKFFPKESLCAFIAASGSSANSVDGDSAWLPIKKADDCGWRLQGSRLNRIVKWPLNWWRNKRAVNRTVDEAVAFAKIHNIELIWAVLDSPTSVAIARRVANRLELPYLVMVWDDIHHNLPYFGVYRLFQKSLLSEWGRTLKQAERCAVIGESMKDEYDRAFGTNAIIVRHGVGPELIQPPATEPSEEGPIRIGFIGSVTAGTAFQAFILALDQNEWRIGGREVYLRLAGHRFDLWCQKPANIEYLGWRSLEDSIAMLSESDINYLPQPFEAGLQAMSRLSFPTKLTTYLAAGRPVLLHCPKTASLFRFHQENPFGICVDSLEQGEIVSALECLLSDRKRYSDRVSAGQAALEKEFSSERFYSSFAEFIGIEETASEDQSQVQEAFSSPRVTHQ
jgi:glycosyltransferase involved in cell wall biosynthesis